MLKITYSSSFYFDKTNQVSFSLLANTGDVVGDSVIVLLNKQKDHTKIHQQPNKPVVNPPTTTVVQQPRLFCQGNAIFDSDQCIRTSIYQASERDFFFVARRTFLGKMGIRNIIWIWNSLKMRKPRQMV